MKKYLFFFLCGLYVTNVSGQLYYAGTMFESYYDMNPDTLINYKVTPYTNETFGFNIFEDASDDLVLTAHGAVSSGGSSAYISITSLNPHVSVLFGRLDSVFVPASSGWDVTKVAKPLIVTDPIDAPGAQWENGTLYLTDHSGHGGGNKSVNDWVGSDKFLGIKCEIGSSISYGWIRLRLPNSDSCYVEDLSYSQVSIGIKELSESNIELFPNPSRGSFYLKNLSKYAFDPSKFSLTNIYGQNIKFTHELIGADAKIIPGDHLPPGCYIFQCYSEKYVFRKKLVRTE